jgi:hypothetical protein
MENILVCDNTNIFTINLLDQNYIDYYMVSYYISGLQWLGTSRSKHEISVSLVQPPMYFYT